MSLIISKTTEFNERTGDFPLSKASGITQKTFEKVLGKNNANAYLNTPILNGHDRTWKGS